MTLNYQNSIFKLQELVLKYAPANKNFVLAPPAKYTLIFVFIQPIQSYIKHDISFLYNII